MFTHGIPLLQAPHLHVLHHGEYLFPPEPIDFGNLELCLVVLPRNDILEVGKNVKREMRGILDRISDVQDSTDATFLRFGVHDLQGWIIIPDWQGISVPPSPII
jgi:hypothetical protein